MTTTINAASAAEIEAHITALQQQLDDATDAIGASALDWRHAAANPGAAARAAQHLSEKESTRDLLAAALAQAQQALAQLHADARAARFQALAAEAREQVTAALERRTALGVQLAHAVKCLGDVVQVLHEQGHEVAHIFKGGSPAFLASGVGVSDVAIHLNKEDWRYVADQLLGLRLGKLWPTETAGASQNIDIAERIKRECVPVRITFEQGLAQRLKGVGQ